MTSDIFLKQDGIEAVTTNGKSLAVTTGEDEDPDVRLSPNSATLKLGGGAGDYSDGDIRLMDRPDGGGSKPRIHLTGGKGSTDSGTRIRFDGSDGTAKLGAESADDPDIQLLPTKADIQLGGGSGGDSVSDGGIKLLDGDGRQRVFVESGGSAPRQGDRAENAVYLTAGGPGFERPDGTDGDAGQLVLSQVGDDFEDATVSLDGGAAQLTLGSDIESGDLLLYREDLLRTVSIDGDDATVLVGNGNSSKGEAGSLGLADENGALTVFLESDAATESGGLLSVAHESGQTTVDASGGQGRLALGNGAAGSGVAGTLTLENASGKTTATVASKSTDTNGAALSLGHATGDETAGIEGGTATLSLGNGSAGGGVAGSIDLVDASGKTTVNVDSDRASDGAGLELNIATGQTTADIDAGERELKLGGAGVGGTILLTDGQGTTFELTVQDGTIRLGSAANGKVAMELVPDEGIFRIIDGNDETGFQVDTERKTIKKGQKYTGGVVGRGS